MCELPPLPSLSFARALPANAGNGDLPGTSLQPARIRDVGRGDSRPITAGISRTSTAGEPPPRGRPTPIRDAARRRLPPDEDRYDGAPSVDTVPGVRAP